MLLLDDMAESWRDTGINIVGEAPWGTHFCHFFDTKQDLLDILVPDLGRLNAHELCVWITFNPLTKEEALEALRSVVPATDEHLRAGDILVVPHSEMVRRRRCPRSRCRDGVLGRDLQTPLELGDPVIAGQWK